MVNGNITWKLAYRIDLTGEKRGGMVWGRGPLGVKGQDEGVVLNTVCIKSYSY